MSASMNRALLGLTRRAERNDPATLVSTFVDVGSLFTLLSSRDHQVLYGRRGTGKTHALQYLAQTVRQGSDVAVYVDMRTIGSSGGIYADPAIPIAERGTRLLADTLSNVFNTLMTEVLQASYETDLDFSAAMIHLERLGDSLTDVRVVGDEERETTAALEREGTDKAAIGFTLSKTPTITASAEASQREGEKASVRVLTRGPLRHRVHFGAVSGALAGVADSLPGRIWLLLDEWSDVPMDLQPLLADLLRRCVLPVGDVTVKIGAIEQRSNFRQPDTVGGYVGLELGADIAADVDLDDFMVFGNDAESAKTFFKELLFRHVKAALAGDAIAPRDSDDFVRMTFTQSTAFAEFVRAAEGIPRDAINIVALAAQTAGDDALSVPIVRSAARKWYLRDKENIAEASGDATGLLHWIVDEVIRGRRARAFLLRQGEASNDPLILALYDARVLHVIKRGVSALDQPGVRFNVYSLDYGCYVDLISTGSEPLGLLPGEDTEDKPIYVEVPPDDYRSIRRAILQIDAFRRVKGAE